MLEILKVFYLSWQPNTAAGGLKSKLRWSILRFPQPIESPMRELPVKGSSSPKVSESLFRKTEPEATKRIVTGVASVLKRLSWKNRLKETTQFISKRRISPQVPQCLICRSACRGSRLDWGSDSWGVEVSSILFKVSNLCYTPEANCPLKTQGLFDTICISPRIWEYTRTWHGLTYADPSFSGPQLSPTMGWLGLPTRPGTSRVRSGGRNGLEQDMFPHMSWIFGNKKQKA